MQVDRNEHGEVDGHEMAFADEGWSVERGVECGEGCPLSTDPSPLEVGRKNFLNCEIKKSGFYACLLQKKLLVARNLLGTEM